MRKLKQLRTNRKGISSLFIAIYVALLAIIIFSTLFIGLSISQSSLASYSKIEQERTQESILIRGPRALNVTLSNGHVESLLVNNVGGIAVRIRSLYIGGEFICDPSTFQGDSYISPQSSVSFNISSYNINIYNNTILTANWTVTTERGSKSSETGANLWLGPPDTPDDANKFYFGPLLLLFNMFHWSNDGITWNNGWTIPEAPGDVIWQIMAANIDSRPIVLNASSSFALIQNSKQSNKIASWNIGPSTLNPSEPMKPGTYYLIHFSLNGPNSLVDISTPNPVTLNFMTIIGSFIEINGSYSGFAQTIPFEAVKISATTEIPTYTTLNAIPSPQTVRQPVTVSGQVTVDAGADPVPKKSIVMMQYCEVGSQEWENILTPVIETGTGGLFTGSFSPPHAGTYEYRAIFMGANDIWAYSASASQIITINKAPSRTTLTLISPITIGQSTTLTATVNVSFATGVVNFEVSTDGGTTYNQLDTSSLSAGTAVLPYKPPIPGTSYRFIATYTGNADVLASPTSTAVSLTVNKANPTISTPILNPPSPIVLGQSVTASVTFTGVPGINPTENLTFRTSTDGGATWSFLCNKTIGTNPIISEPYIPVTVGTLYRIRAEYAGDINYNSASSQVPFVVKTLPTVSTPTILPASPITYGTSVTVTATVSGSYGTPTGSITFEVSTNGGSTFTPFSTRTLSAGSATSAPYQPPSAGLNYQFRAVYAGDNTYLSATSPTAPLTVTKAPTTTTISFPTTMPANQPLRVTATVTIPPAPSPATGTVSFEFSTDGTNYSPFGNPTTLTAGTALSDPITLTAPPNSYIFRATYNGDSNFYGSSSPPSTLYLVSFTQAGVGTDYMGTVMSINGLNYGRAGYSAWFAPNANIVFSYQNTLSVSSGKQYLLTGVDGTSPLTVASPITVTGAYQTQYSITASAGPNGSIDPTGTTFFTAGSSQTYTITPSPGYHIDTLIVDGTTEPVTSSYSFTNIASSHSITATFAIDQFTIVASAGANGAISPNGNVVVTYDSSQTFTITPSLNYHVADVLVDGSSVGAVSSYTFTNVISSHTIAASFAIDTYTITVTSGTNGAISPGTLTTDYGTTPSFSILPDTGYHVLDVKVDGTTIGPITTYTFASVTADHTIEATFEVNTYTLTVTQTAYGTITPGTTTVSYGDSLDFTISADTGYYIVEVTVDGVPRGAVSTYSLNDIQEDHTISATYAIDQFTITASAGTGGTISPSGSIIVNYGSDQTFTVAADTGYNIADVTVDGASVGTVSTYTFTNITTNHTINATFG